MKDSNNTDRYWWVHHESEAIDFVNSEEEIYDMQRYGLVEPITEELAQELINRGYHFDLKRLLE